MSSSRNATAARLLVRRDDLARLQFERPCGDAEARSRSGQAQLRIEHFALTANNITCAAFGESMRYWQFFRAGDRWGCIPVWGFATVTESRAEGAAVGERVYGHLPMATHLVAMAAAACCNTSTTPGPRSCCR